MPDVCACTRCAPGRVGGAHRLLHTLLNATSNLLCRAAGAGGTGGAHIQPAGGPRGAGVPRPERTRRAAAHRGAQVGQHAGQHPNGEEHDDDEEGEHGVAARQLLAPRDP